MTKKGNTMAGLTSLPQKKNIKGQPHKLAYITEAESDLLKSMGGAGKPVQGTKGVPAYYSDAAGDGDVGDVGTMGGGDDFDFDYDIGFSGTDQAASAAAAAAEGGSEALGSLADDAFGAARQAAAEAERAANVKGFTEEEAAELADITGVRGLPSTLDLGSLADIDAYHEGYYDTATGQTKSDAQYAMAVLNELGQKGMNTTAQDLLNSRAYSGLGIKEMNELEKDYNLNTFGLGYRGAFEARSPKGLSRDEYDPNTLTGAGTDAASDNRALFASFARANPSLSTVEALSQYNATSNPDEQVSISDVQNMGFELNAPVGPQADFREAEAQRGFGQGLGMIGRSLAFGPIGAMTDIALSGTGKGVLGHIGDMFEKASGYELPEVPDFGLPTIQGTVEDLVGPSKDTMDPASFGIDAEISSASNLTDADVGYTDMGLGSFTPDGNESQIALSAPISSEPIIKEQEEIIETPSPAFPTIDTVPQSSVDRIASIYNISKEAAEKMLGVTA